MKEEMFYKALEIATEAHKDQKRKGNGEPYIMHCKRVARFKNDVLDTIAILHDVIEDHPKFGPLIRKTFPKNVFDTLQLLDRKNKNYFDFIMNIRNSQNRDAIAVKISDLKDNMRDLQEGAKKDKYRFALYILTNVL